MIFKDTEENKNYSATGMYNKFIPPPTWETVADLPFGETINLRNGASSIKYDGNFYTDHLEPDTHINNIDIFRKSYYQESTSYNFPLNSYMPFSETRFIPSDTSSYCDPLKMAVYVVSKLIASGQVITMEMTGAGVVYSNTIKDLSNNIEFKVDIEISNFILDMTGVSDFVVTYILNFSVTSGFFGNILLDLTPVVSGSYNIRVSTNSTANTQMWQYSGNSVFNTLPGNVERDISEDMTVLTNSTWNSVTVTPPTSSTPDQQAVWQQIVNFCKSDVNFNNFNNFKWMLSGFKFKNDI